MKKWFFAVIALAVLFLLAAVVFSPQEDGSESRTLSAKKEDARLTKVVQASKASGDAKQAETSEVSRYAEKLPDAVRTEKPVVPETKAKETVFQMAPPLAYCGNRVCDASESCFSCVEDCGCNGKEECTGAGVCRIPPSCGGKQCSEEQFCNHVTESCVEPIVLDEETRLSVVQAYLEKEETLDGKPVKFVGSEDSYYRDKTVKALYFDCSSAELHCSLDVLVDENGKVLKEYRSG
ncbi:hypothetical protein HZC09_03635 [Candidatus Micrarchaeota archaeon]|nr:hypothetical protein [Candidatus Micrarchaeota archaeon]